MRPVNGLRHVVIVGGGLGGIKTAESLRGLDFSGNISLVSAEEHLPYDRPPLSKKFLSGDWDRERISLTSFDHLRELRVDLFLGNPAVSVRPGEVVLADGTRFDADAIVLATGLRPRELPGQPPAAHVLRSLDDAERLRAALQQSSSLLVIGAGFIGGEVASSARDMGVDVTVVESDSVPLHRVLGAEAGTLSARLMTERGVRLLCGSSVASTWQQATTPEGLTGGMRATLTDGTSLEADVLLVGIGGRPDPGWLVEPGVDIENGVACDQNGRVKGTGGFWAVGDVSAWPQPRGLGIRSRHEHWTSANDQATIVARDVMGLEPSTSRPTPYFWSDQFGLKIQLIGHPERSDEMVPLAGTGLDGGPIKGTTLGYLRAGALVAVAGFGAGGHIARLRPHVEMETDISEVERSLVLTR